MQKPIGAKSDAAYQFVSSPKKMLINNEWVNGISSRTIEVINPSTKEKLCEVALAGRADIDLAVEAAQKAFEGRWKNLSPHERSAYLFRIADLIEKNVEELAEIQTYDMGMIRSHSKHLVQAQADTFRYYAGWITKINGDTLPTDGHSFTYTLREPLGVVGAIIPWNGPMLATAWKIAPAIAFGNTVVLKPSEEAPLTSLRFGEILVESGLPAGVVNILTGLGDQAGARLIEHPDVAKISFTGSTKVGKGIIRDAAETMKKVTLELGGKSAAIIFPDADMNIAIANVIAGFTAGTGQACVCGARILAHESIFEQVKTTIGEQIARLKIGSPFDPATQIAPLAFERHYNRVCDYLEIGVNEGASVVSGGKKVNDTGFFVEPTLFANVYSEMRIYREEIFGPVAVIVPFKDEEDAIRIANDSNYGLAGSVFTQNLKTAYHVSAAIKSGIVWVNTNLELDIKAPFGGYKQSGVGRELGRESIDAYTQIKTVAMRF